MMGFQSNLLSQTKRTSHRFSTPIEAPPQDFVRCHQVHSDLVMTVADEPSQIIAESKVDGLVTSRSERPIGIQTADCLPVLISGTSGSSKMIAAIHAGWRGLHQGILLQAIKKFSQEGFLPEQVFAAIGPGIGACCFEVGQEVLDSFAKDWGKLLQNKIWFYSAQPQSQNLARSQAPVSGGKPWLDLDVIARQQLLSVGLPNSNIEDVGFCTYCGPGELASYRRATHNNGDAKRKRQWSWISITK